MTTRLQLKKILKEALFHLQKRGLSIEIINKFKLGYSLNKKDALLSLFRDRRINANTMKESGLFVDVKNGYIDRFSGFCIQLTTTWMPFERLNSGFHDVFSNNFAINNIKADHI